MVLCVRLWTLESGFGCDKGLALVPSSPSSFLIPSKPSMKGLLDGPGESSLVRVIGLVFCAWARIGPGGRGGDSGARMALGREGDAGLRIGPGRLGGESPSEDSDLAQIGSRAFSFPFPLGDKDRLLLGRDSSSSKGV